jgi:hypothetical protein
MGGPCVVLLEAGDLAYAYWREDPLGNYWIVSDFAELTANGMTMPDYGDHCRWRKVRPLQGEQYREELDRSYGLSVHAAGVALSQSLKRLLEGQGARLDGHITGLRQTPLGP